MSGLFAFLGIARDVAWVYMGVMFLVATGLFFYDRGGREVESKDAARPRERKAA